MARTDFTTTDCAAHVAQYIHAQPAAPRLLTLDERIDQLKAALIVAKATDNQPEIERLRSVWQELRAEIDAEEATSADLAALPFEPTIYELRETRTTIIVDAPGLNYAQITVRADSYVAMTEHQQGSHLYAAIVVDGRYFDLVRVAHVDSNPDLVAAFNRVMDQVEDAVKALQPATPTAALSPLVICPKCNQVRDDLNRCGCDYTVYIDLDCLIAAHEAQDATKAQQSAWEYLSEISSVTMRGAAYRIPSAKWSDTIYTSTATSCTCPARKRCWHQYAAATLDLARENEAIDTLAERWAA